MNDRLLLDVWAKVAPNMPYDEALKIRKSHKRAIDYWERVTLEKFMKGRVEHKDEDYRDFTPEEFTKNIIEEFMDAFIYYFVMSKEAKNANVHSKSNDQD